MEPRWGILSVFPRPMPTLHNAKVFPHLFSSNKSLDVSLLPLDKELASINENRSFELLGSLCFVGVRNISDYSDCVMLYNQSAAWFDAPHSMTLFREKRDFGITAAIVTAISINAAGAVTAAIAMDHAVQTASTLNDLSSNVAAALDAQAAVSSQLKEDLWWLIKGLIWFRSK